MPRLRSPDVLVFGTFADVLILAHHRLALPRPRGISKEHAAIDQWMKDISPRTALRKWFGHDPARWDEFRRRYAKEVHQNADLLDQLRTLARQGPITLVYSAHDEVHNDAVELRNLLLGR